VKENSDGNDTNVGSIGNSIEEDIILLKDFTEGNLKRDKLENYKGSYKMGYFYCKNIQQAIEHILSDYKRVSKENEQLRTEVNSLKKENEELKKDYYNVINKIENKIDILDIAISGCIYIDDDDKAYKKAVKKDKLCLLNQKRALQELLEEGDLE
jgi:predicted RNase H-like nuclease (RuvC/YqgF family)